MIGLTQCTVVTDQLLILLVVLSSLLACYSYGCLIHEGQPKSEKIDWSWELFAVIHPLVSNKYLNDQARKWRWVFYISLIVVELYFLLKNVYGLCSSII